MNVIYNILGPILLIPFLYYLFIKIRNVMLINKHNYKEDYTNIKKEIKNKKIVKVLFYIIVALVSLFVIYLLIGVGIILFSPLFILLAIALPNNDSVETYSNFISGYFITYKYIPIYLYVMGVFIVSRLVYINTKAYKILNENSLIKAKEETSSISNKATESSETKGEDKNLWILCVLALVIIGGIFLFFSNYDNQLNFSSIDLEKVAIPPMNIGSTLTPSWYFFQNDKLYVYEISYYDRLYSTDLNARGEEEIARTEKLRYANIFMVYNNEAFYYTPYSNSVKKVNLTTGEIKDIIDDKYLYLMADTINDRKVLVNYNNDRSGMSHSFFGLLDLETGEISNSQKVKHSTKQPYFYDLHTGKVYYTDYSENLYENDQNIYIKNNGKDVLGAELVFVQEGYLFVICDNKVKKVDLTSYEILEEKKIDNMYFLISSVRSGGGKNITNPEGPAKVALYPIFTSDNENDSGVYKFNSKTLSFEKIIDNNFSGGFLQKYQDCYVLQTDIQTVIFNEKNNKYKIYNSANFTVEGEYIYMLTYTGDFYHQKENNLKFKIEKILLKDVLK